jgi:transposase
MVLHPQREGEQAVELRACRQAAANMIPFELQVERLGIRESDRTSESLLSYVDIEQRVQAKDPLRLIKGIVDKVLVSLPSSSASARGAGRQSIAPERLLRASLLQAFYLVCSERQLMEQIDYILLFR